jgi:hypothetical protein
MAFPGTKKNVVKKGEGKDSAKDQYDNYVFSSGWSYLIMSAELGHAPTAETVFKVCKYVWQKATDLLVQNRWAKRRLANAHAWLDRNKEVIPADLLREAVRAAGK